jgi:hypothetical protein
MVPLPAARLLIVLTGIVAGQLVLYGPSLFGSKILLPLDILAQKDFYIPQTPEARQIVAHDPIMSDLVLLIEPWRQFAGTEIRAGRLPFWCPNLFAGAPNYRMNFAPPSWPGYLIKSPIVLAYTQLLLALIAGVGDYAVSRRVLDVRFLPSVVAAWCYPLTGAFVFSTGMGSPPVICWLPWIIVAVEQTVRRPWSWGGPALGVLTSIVLIGGEADVAGQVLICSGLFALWRLGDRFRASLCTRRAVPAVLFLTMGWILGILSATWILIPLIQYAETGQRIVNRLHGVEERPPVGLSALPRLLAPEFDGCTVKGSMLIAGANIPESAASGYAGLLAALVVAPMAWCSRRHWSINAFWVALGFVGLSWILDVPGMVWLLRLPGLNFMSHNRFVFATGFAILSLATIGLDALLAGFVRRQRWFAILVLLLAGLGGWSAYRAVCLPEPFSGNLASAVKDHPVGPMRTVADLEQVENHLTNYYTSIAVLSLCGMATLLLIWAKGWAKPWVGLALSTVMMGELFWQAFGYVVQSDRSLYYPSVPVLERLKALSDGRVIGIRCLPPDLAQTQGLRDVRGYDSVDPARYVDLLQTASIPGSMTLPYAMTQWMSPQMELSDTGQVRLSPILDMLNVRYVIFRDTPDIFFRKFLHRRCPPQFTAMLQGFDYWVLRNDRAMPRTYIPREVQCVGDGKSQLERLADPNFSPARVAYVEAPIEVPTHCTGSAEIINEVSTHLTISAHMQTPGLLVLADLWDPGWHAYADGEEQPILRVNHAIRGVVLPAGATTVDFRYEPVALKWGAILSALSALVCLCWFVRTRSHAWQVRT